MAERRWGEGASWWRAVAEVAAPSSLRACRSRVLLGLTIPALPHGYARAGWWSSRPACGCDAGVGVLALTCRLPDDVRGVPAVVPDDAACVEYLARLRWPEGFVCPVCTGSEAWRTGTATKPRSPHASSQPRMPRDEPLAVTHGPTDLPTSCQRTGRAWGLAGCQLASNSSDMAWWRGSRVSYKAGVGGSSPSAPTKPQVRACTAVI